MKPRTLILMVVAIGCGLAASYMTSQYMSNKGQQAEEEKVKVLVATKNLQIHQLIKEPEKLFEEKEFPKSLEPKKAIKEYSELVGQRLNRSIREGDHITKDDLLDKSKDPFVGMPPGYRAFAIKTNVDSAVAGFVQPQSRIDIIAVIRSGQNQEVTSRTILQNVLVLAVDQTPIRAEDKVATVPSTVTVQVTDRDAQKLALASDLGQLKLSLRSTDDDKTVAGGSVNLKELLSGSSAPSNPEEGSEPSEKPAPPRVKTPMVAPAVPELPTTPVQPEKEKEIAKKPEPKPEPKTHTLTLYKGTQVVKDEITIPAK